MTPDQGTFGAPSQGGRAGRGTVPADGPSPASTGGGVDAGTASGPAQPDPGRPLERGARRPGRQPAWGARASPRARFRRWLAHRLPASDTWVLGQRNVYILPTRAGFTFAATLLVMLLASINYQLSLGYALTFLLAGAAVVSMHLTHGNLRGLTLHLRPPAPGWAGDAAPLEVVLNNPGAERHGLMLCPDDDTDAAPAWCDVPRGGEARVRLSVVPPQRGRHRVPVLRVQTHFPFGLFRAWTVWRPAAQLLAWPRPEAAPPPLPLAAATAGTAHAARRGAGSELDGVRPWRRGDSMRQVVWKKVAHSGELVSRETAGAAHRELWLHWQDTHGADVEQRLSRLAAWVLRAEAEGIECGLRLPGQELPPGHGEAHRRAALERLALWT